MSGWSARAGPRGPALQSHEHPAAARRDELGIAVPEREGWIGVDGQKIGLRLLRSKRGLCIWRVNWFCDVCVSFPFFHEFKGKPEGKVHFSGPPPL